MGGTERPQELFEEEFHKEVSRMAKAKGGPGLTRFHKPTDGAPTNGGPALDPAAKATDKVEEGRDHVP